jgi:hypothetical protein
LLLVALVALPFAFAVHVDFPLCPLAGTFGIPCPGCGLTRATLALLHGDVRAALHFHPLVWLLSPLFVAFMSGALVELVRGPTAPPLSLLRGFRWNARLVSIVGLLLLTLSTGVWVARFAGYFGGPVPVTSLRDWLALHQR